MYTPPAQSSQQPQQEPQPQAQANKATRKRKKFHQRGHEKAILDYLQHRIGLHTTPANAAEEVGPHFNPPMNNIQAGQALTRLHNKGIVERVAPGVYVYHGRQLPNGDSASHSTQQPIADSHLYETVGTLTDGTPVVRSDDGQLFAIVSLEAKIRKEA